MGLQLVASYCALGCYYLIAIPMACTTGFWAGLGVIGLHLGFLAAVFVQALAYMCILRRRDWQDIADEAVKRIKAEEMERIEAE